MGSKNNPKNRGVANDEKFFDGKKVKPVLYVGSNVGHGRYIAAQDESGKMITDQAAVRCRGARSKTGSPTAQAPHAGGASPQSR